MGGLPGGADAILAPLLEEYHRVDLHRLTGLLMSHYRGLGVQRAVIFLADVQQRELRPLPGGDHHASLPIDSTLADWAYRTQSERIARHEANLTVWLPMSNGVERIGVLEVETSSLDGQVLERCRSLAALLALMLVAKRSYSDVLAQCQRISPMGLASEMVWAFLPPRTIGNMQGTSTAVLEPAYDLGGDSFDHSLIRETLHTTVVDSMGHDLTAGLLSAVAIAACRNARRRGADLAGVAAFLDDTLRESFPDQHATAILADLDLATGRLSWMNFGHPPPLLLRGQNVVAGALDGGTGEPPVRPGRNRRRRRPPGPPGAA